MATVLITGASKGIGFEAAIAFARAGYIVHATMRRPDKAPALAELAAAHNLPITISTMDVDSDDSVRTCMAAVLERGSLDVLVNNAGVEAIGAVEEIPLAEFRAIMETNFFGALRCIQAALPHMRAAESGCIVNVSSIAGRMAMPPMAAYCASKWALEAMSEALAAEVKPSNIRVAIVEPGIIDTAMARRIGGVPAPSAYGHSARFSAMFSGSLQNPVPPSPVAEKILHVVQSGTWQLRHLVGPDAAPLVGWRGTKSDEEWIDISAGDDAQFFTALSQAGT